MNHRQLPRRGRARLAAIAAVGVTAASLLSSCGGAGNEYCDALQLADESFTQIARGDFTAVDSVLEDLADARQVAPEQLKEDWAIYEGSMRNVQNAVDEAGISTVGLAEIRESTQPSDEQLGQLEQVEAAMEDVDIAALTEAGRNISEHAQSECDPIEGTN